MYVDTGDIGDHCHQWSFFSFLLLLPPTSFFFLLVVFPNTDFNIPLSCLENPVLAFILHSLLRLPALLKCPSRSSSGLLPLVLQDCPSSSFLITPLSPGQARIPLLDPESLLAEGCLKAPNCTVTDIPSCNEASGVRACHR